MFLDANGKSLVTTNGGTLSSLNNTAAALIQAGALRLCRIIIVAPGSGSGAFTINDSATLAGAAAANEVWSLPYNATSNVAGASFSLDWPMANGLVLSAVPGAGSPVIALSYTF
jgi:hypothetical protein